MRNGPKCENQYQRRADLIPNLVQTVSGAANFEKSTLTEVTQARASVGQIKLDPSTRPPILASSSNSSRPRASSATRSPACSSSRNGIPTSRPIRISWISRPNWKGPRTASPPHATISTSPRRPTTRRSSVSRPFSSPAMLGFTERPYFQAKEGSETPPAVNFDFNDKKGG